MPSKNIDFNSQLVYHLVSLIPKGKVLTYGKIAEILSFKSKRLVGRILHQNKNPEKVSCHRVVFVDGTLSKNYAFGGLKGQYLRLKNEGIKFYLESDRCQDRIMVDLRKSLWQINEVLRVYFFLLKNFGFSGPWPWFKNGQPSTKEEIIIESILTQNTSWKNVKKAMINLKKNNLNNLKSIYFFGQKNLRELKKLIRPSGFFNQKSERLFLFSKFIIEEYDHLENFSKLSLENARKALLSQKGVGKETADTILLYALEKPIFVIDKYTQKFAEKYFLNSLKKQSDCPKILKTYDLLQKFFINNLPCNIVLFQNYHGLIVEGRKRNFF
jgi:endonuclease-3 related protein